MTEEKKIEEKKSASNALHSDADKQDATSEEKVVVPEKFKKLVEEIEKMSVLDLSELVKILEDKFNVSAAAPMMMGAMPAAGAGEVGEVAEAKSEFNVEVTEAGSSKINAIKTVREITGLGLKDAKDLVDAAPKVIKEKVAKEEAEEMKKKLEEAGATVTLK